MKRDTGYSLIEVMLTMLIVSVGLLGIAGVMANNIKVTRSAQVRGQASVLLNDIVDRMRANRDIAEVSPSPYALALDALPDAEAGVPGADLNEWRRAIAAAVPSGVGAVAVNASTGNVTVTIQWNDARARGSAAQQMVLVTHL